MAQRGEIAGVAFIPEDVQDSDVPAAHRFNQEELALLRKLQAEPRPSFITRQ